mmetsp:Transcript_24603/g.36226  ORF Transcript_24603/g.36226 Transcript_24603/m.36226 type:complete len:206 (-) Transcript_24603:443-1060(-)
MSPYDILSLFSRSSSLNFSLNSLIKVGSTEPMRTAVRIINSLTSIVPSPSSMSNIFIKLISAGVMSATILSYMASSSGFSKKKLMNRPIAITVNGTPVVVYRAQSAKFHVFDVSGICRYPAPDKVDSVKSAATATDHPSMYKVTTTPRSAHITNNIIIFTFGKYKFTAATISSNMPSVSAALAISSCFITSNSQLPLLADNSLAI